MKTKTDKQVSNRHIGMFKPGQSGNPKGRPPNTKYMSEYLNVELHKIDKKTGKTLGLLVVETIIQDAIKGKPDARALIWERVEGKVVQPIGGDADQPITIQLIPAIQHQGGINSDNQRNGGNGGNGNPNS